MPLIRPNGLRDIAFAIKRFDRHSTDQTTERIHSEDFAQIFGGVSASKNTAPLRDDTFNQES
ncbi:hypothetical protein [Acinetobacter sp. ANC 4639]